jgi:hypothetical protein
MSNPFDAPPEGKVTTDAQDEEFRADFGLSGERRERPGAEVVSATGGRGIITMPGFYPDVTPDQYFAEPCPGPALTSSGIKILAKPGAAPAKFAHAHPAIGQPAEERKSTAAQYRGSLVHRLALDKGRDFVVSPYDAYRSNEAKAWRDGIEASGRMPVKEAEMSVASDMADRIRPHIVAACEGHPYETEVVIAWQERVELMPSLHVDVWCRAMLDVWCPSIGLALDVKTCRAADDDTVDRAFADGYAVQDAWYLRGLNALAGQTEKGRARFGFLFVESEAPYLPRDVSASEGYRHGARMLIERALWQFARCIHHNDWPGYEPHRATPTPWFLKAAEALSQEN